MENVTWHKIKDFDYPQPFKDVLVINESSRYMIAYYKGETDVYPWYDYLTQKNSKGLNFLYWCELPKIPTK